MHHVLSRDTTRRPAPLNQAFVRARNERDGFLRYFGFRQIPFGVTPDPGLLFFSSMHRAALESMIHSIESNLGFTVLLGGPGTGKTTLLFQLLTQYRDCARTAFIFQTQCGSHDLLRHIASELELPVLKHDEVSLHQRLKRMLVKEAHAGRKVLIIIDEAQNLHYSSLEAIRLLSDFETAPAKLLHVVLAGSSRLAETLLAPHLSQLAQRVFTVCRLEALTVDEVKAYVNFRLGAVGSRVVEGLFSPESLWEIAERSGGVPRLVNAICYRALSLAYTRGERHVSRTLAQQAARDLDLSRSIGMNLPAIAPWPKAVSHDGPNQLADVNSRATATGVESLGSGMDTQRAEPVLKIESQPFAATPMNGSEERRHSEARSATVPAADQDERRLTHEGRLRHASAKRIRVLRPVGFRRPRFNDSSSIALGALILLGLGFWTVWHELWPKFAPPGEYTTSARPAVTPPESKYGAVHTPPGLPDAPIAIGETNKRVAEYKPNGAATPHPTSPVITTLPDGVLPSRITRPSSNSGDPAVPNNVAVPARESDPLIQPLTTVPPSVPQLNGSVATQQSTGVVPAPVLQPTKVVQPEYPKVAKLRHIEGDVVLELEIDSQGNVEKVRTVSGNAMLKEAAEQAAWQWHYPSFTPNQLPVPAVTQVRFNFRLDPDAGK
jgi:TonB family protein